jgi:hypothetical protein
MVHKKVVGFGLAAAGFFIIALLVAGAVIGGDGGMADDRIADLSGSEGGCGDSLAASPVTSGFNYQGRLTDSSGNPLNGTYDITFRLYDAASGGTALAEVLHSVIVHNGLFATTITFDPTYFDGRALWLGIQVGYDPEMTPRQALRAVPYALSLRPGAVIEGSLFDEPILWARNSGENGNALNAGVAGNGGIGVRVVALGEESQGVRTWSNGTDSVGVHAITTGDNSEGVVAETQGADCVGVGIFTSGDGSEGVYAYTTGNDSDGVYAWTTGDGSPAVYGWSDKDVGVYGVGKESGGYFTTTAAGILGHAKLGVNVSTQYDHNYGISASTSGNNSPGVLAVSTGNVSAGYFAQTSGYDSIGFFSQTFGDSSEGLFVLTTGNGSPAVYGHSEKDVGVYGEGYDAGGYFTTTAAGENIDSSKPGVIVSTQYDHNPGVLINTGGDGSNGVYVRTYGDSSDGVYVQTYGDFSCGVRAYTDGNASAAVVASAKAYNTTGLFAWSIEGNAIEAGTGRDHNWAFYTADDNIYVGGKIDLVGTVDPIIVEGFNADPVAKYEVGDVVCLAESGTVKQCSKADDTRVAGVVGPTVELEDGEITVVIMGHQGAKPDEEHVQVLEQRLERAEAQKVEAQQLTSTEKLEEAEKLDSEIGMLRNQLDEAKSVTRQVVRVKADGSYGAIKVGDLLTTSATSGHAMKARPISISGVEIYRPGTIIGKALEPLNSGTGLIEVFVTLQ